MDFILYTQGDGTSPLPFTLPLRSLSVSFPTLPPDYPGDTYVRFDGEFGVSFSDSRYLWRAIKQSQRTLRGKTLTLVDNADTDVPSGAMARVRPTESANGSRKTFTFPFRFYKGQFDLYMNGLYQRENIDFSYVLQDKQVTFLTAPGDGDGIWAVGYVSGAS
jgi:hypothetical protein